MLPVVAGVGETRRQIWFYTLALVPVTFAPALLGAAGWLYTAVAIVMNTGFVWFAWKIYAAKSDKALGEAPKKLFKFSILYLFVMFSALLVEWAIGLPKFAGLGV